MTMFERASRKKLRFVSPKGLLAVEDLWDLPLTAQVGKTSLDSLAIEQHKKVSDNTAGLSFVIEKTAVNEDEQLRMDILLHVIKTRMEENAANRLAADRAAEKQKIMRLIAEKREDALSQFSIEELEERLKKL